MDPVEVAEEERRRARGTRGRLDGSQILRNVDEKTQFVHQLRQLVMTTLHNYVINTASLFTVRAQATSRSRPQNELER